MIQGEYKGYTGYVNYSIDDKVFYGIIRGIKDLVTYESDTEEGLERSFQEAVDDYIDLKSRLKAVKN